tara:strand:+ start:822 stop:1709 length:888 start_codon:yes stop_codon:yes gene_type:complete
MSSSSNICEIKNNKYTYKEVSTHNKKYNCLISVNGSVYDIYKYKTQLIEQMDNDDEIFLDIECGANYNVIKERDIFQLKKIKKSINKGIFLNLKNKIKSKYYYDDEERIKYLNINELNKELSKRGIPFHEKNNTDEKILRKRIIMDNEKKKKNRIYGLFAKFVILGIIIGIYLYTNNEYILYLLLSVLIYQIYVNIIFLFFDFGFEQNCVGSGILKNYSNFKIGVIENYNTKMYLYYAIFVMFIIFILIYYYKTRNIYVLLTILLIFLFNSISMYKAYKLKNKIFNEILNNINEN